MNYRFLNLYERDNETNLNFARARYLSNAQGRFVSADPAMGSAKPEQPETCNRYTYTVNNPLRFVDPSGLDWGMKRTGNSVEYVWFDGEIGEGYEKVTEFYVEGYIDGKNVSLSLNPDGPRPSWTQFLLEYEAVGLLLADNSDYIVKGYAIVRLELNGRSGVEPASST